MYFIRWYNCNTTRSPSPLFWEIDVMHKVPFGSLVLPGVCAAALECRAPCCLVAAMMLVMMLGISSNGGGGQGQITVLA